MTVRMTRRSDAGERSQSREEEGITGSGYRKRVKAGDVGGTTSGGETPKLLSPSISSFCFTAHSYRNTLDIFQVISVMSMWTRMQPAYAGNMWNAALNMRLGTEVIDKIRIQNSGYI
ncbi:hypothetical protein LXL04_007727 [Taraxacum kok-saghyz]